jgi:hypothetical protein
MAVQLSDKEIARLVAEQKELPADWLARIQLRPKRGHKEQELELKGTSGAEFVLIFRQSDFNAMDFSVILGYRIPKSSVVFHLRRYNGKHGEHTNIIEGQTFYGFHIHSATERYQQLGRDAEAFAEPTDRYGDLHGAVRCMVEDCGLVEPRGTQLTLS